MFLRNLGVLFAALLGVAGISGQAMAEPAERIGVMVSSFGDVDKKEEIESFVKTTLLDPDVAPLPNFARSLIVWLGWELKKKSIYEEYEAIGWATHFREQSQRQADAIAARLRAEGHDARGYAGFTMTFPSVEETLATMRRDGINRVYRTERSISVESAHHKRCAVASLVMPENQCIA